MSNIFWPGATPNTPGQPAILYWVPNLAFLRTIDSTVYDYINIEGYTTPGDGGDGRYFPVPSDTTNGCVFTGTIAGTVLTVTAVTNGSVATGYVVTGTSVNPGTAIVPGGTGTGGIGTYNLSLASTIAAPTGMTADNNTTIIVGLNGIRWHYSPIAFPTISGFQFSGADGTGRNVMAISANTNLAQNQSGTTVFTTGAIAVNPPAGVLGENYIIYGNATGVVTVTPVGGASIEFPDGSTSTTYSLPLSSDDAIGMIFDGTLWRAETIGRVIAAPAVNANEAVTLGQLVGKNKLVNGRFLIDQRNGGNTQAINGTLAYTCDRWYAFTGGTGVTGQALGAGSGYRFTGAAGNTAIVFGQRIESANIYDAASQLVTDQIVLSSSALTTVTWAAYFPTAADNWAGRTQIATGTFTINSVPTRYTTTFNAGPSITAGMEIEYSVGALVAGQTLIFNKAQLEVGGVASAIENLPIALERDCCYRYYYAMPSSSYEFPSPGTGGFAYNQRYDFKQSMRVIPTVVPTYGTTSNLATITPLTSTIDFHIVNYIATGNSNSSWNISLTASAEL